MQVNITFRRFEATDSLKTYALDKVERVKKHLGRPELAEVHVVLSLERHLHHADITIYAQGRIVRGHDACDDMYVAIDLAVERVERQLKRHRDKVRHHHDRNLVHHGMNLIEGEAAREEQPARAPAEPALRDMPRLVRSTETVPTLSAEEAATQLELLDRDFLVFMSQSTRSLAVVYRRNDGHFALIDGASARPGAAESRAV